MGPENQNPLDIASPARAGHQRDHGGPVGPVELFYPLESIRQVTEQLIL
ncbi:MAG: hypothetical protein RIS56_1270, partial [Verrucomicrobiota bacterium]